MVVDDDDLLSGSLIRALRAETVEVDVAGTAVEAIRLLASTSYNLCLLDVQLPDFSGLVLLKIIQDICPRVKVIVMTAGCLDPKELNLDKWLDIRDGISKFIAKPFKLAHLLELVLDTLREGEEPSGGKDRQFVREPGRKGRHQLRRPSNDEIPYSFSVVGDGQSRRLMLNARALDVSESGVGMLTDYPLKADQIISLEHSGLQRAGRVAWSMMLDAETCRAGVCFA